LNNHALILGVDPKGGSSPKETQFVTTIRDKGKLKKKKKFCKQKKREKGHTTPHKEWTRHMQGGGRI